MPMTPYGIANSLIDRSSEEEILDSIPEVSVDSSSTAAPSELSDTNVVSAEKTLLNRP